jgi:DNA-directed RNA polymerase specialized sigma24 family protein
MIAPDLPEEALVHLHSAYLKMRDEPALARRLILVHQIILHPVFRRKLRQVVAKRTDCRGDHQRRCDIMQEATCLLIDWLTAENAPYGDQGPDKFGGWLWTLCRRACARAVHKDQRQKRCGILSLDLSNLTEIAAPPDLNGLRRQILDGIEALPDPEVRAALLDALLGYRIRESAERLGLSMTAVFRLREKGRHELRAADIDFP